MWLGKLGALIELVTVAAAANVVVVGTNGAAAAAAAARAPAAALVVGEEWIQACCDAGRLLPAADYAERARDRAAAAAATAAKAAAAAAQEGAGPLRQYARWLGGWTERLSKTSDLYELTMNVSCGGFALGLLKSSTTPASHLRTQNQPAHTRIHTHTHPHAPRPTGRLFRRPRRRVGQPGLLPGARGDRRLRARRVDQEPQPDGLAGGCLGVLGRSGAECLGAGC